MNLLTPEDLSLAAFLAQEFGFSLEPVEKGEKFHLSFDLESGFTMTLEFDSQDDDFDCVTLHTDAEFGLTSLQCRISDYYSHLRYTIRTSECIKDTVCVSVTDSTDNKKISAIVIPTGRTTDVLLVVGKVVQGYLTN